MVVVAVTPTTSSLVASSVSASVFATVVEGEGESGVEMKGK